MASSFDPDAYLNDGKTSGFDPDAYLGITPPAPSPQDQIQSIIKQAGQAALASSPANLTQKFMQTDPATMQRVGGGALPIAGGLAGGPVGAALGELARQATGTALAPDTVPKTPLGRAASVVSAGVMQEPKILKAIPGVPKVAEMAGDLLAKTKANLARRALGFTKPMLKRWNFGVPEANKVGQEMLDKGVIKFGAGAEANLERAKDLAQQSGKTIGDTLEATDAKIFNPKDVAGSVENQLAPEYGPHIERSFQKAPNVKEPLFTEQKVTGGAYDKTRNIVNEIEKTVKAHGTSEIDFKSAQELKEKLGSIANFLKQQAPERSDLYRKAYGIVSDAIDKGLGTAAEAGQISPESVPAYLAAKKTFGASRRAIEALSNKAAADAGNSILSLRGAAVSAGALASGHVAPALEALGLWEAARRVGAGSAAAALQKASFGAIGHNPAARQVLLQVLQKLRQSNPQDRAVP